MLAEWRKRGDRRSNEHSDRVDGVGLDKRGEQVLVPRGGRCASVRAGRCRWETGGQGALAEMGRGAEVGRERTWSPRADFTQRDVPDQ